jgi:hypothetical protein
MKVVPLRLAPGDDLRQTLETWMGEQQEQAGGDFQERCHSWAAIQAACINVNSRASSFSFGGLFIHTSAG